MSKETRDRVMEKFHVLTVAATVLFAAAATVSVVVESDLVSIFSGVLALCILVAAGAASALVFYSQGERRWLYAAVFLTPFVAAPVYLVRRFVADGLTVDLTAVDLRRVTDPRRFCLNDLPVWSLVSVGPALIYVLLSLERCGSHTPCYTASPPVFVLVAAFLVFLTAVIASSVRRALDGPRLLVSPDSSLSLSVLFFYAAVVLSFAVFVAFPGFRFGESAVGEVHAAFGVFAHGLAVVGLPLYAADAVSGFLDFDAVAPYAVYLVTVASVVWTVTVPVVLYRFSVRWLDSLVRLAVVAVAVAVFAGIGLAFLSVSVPLGSYADVDRPDQPEPYLPAEEYAVEHAEADAYDASFGFADEFLLEAVHVTDVSPLCYVIGTEENATGTFVETDCLTSVVVTDEWGTVKEGFTVPNRRTYFVNASVARGYDTVFGTHPVAPNVDLSGVDLSGKDLGDANLTGADLTGTNLSDADLSDAEMRRANATDANLTGANLRHADISEATLKDSEAEGVVASAADFAGAEMRGVRMRDSSLTAANMTRANLNDADMSDADLHNAELGASTAVNASFDGARMTRVDLTNADLRRATASGSRHGGAETEGCLCPSRFTR